MEIPIAVVNLVAWCFLLTVAVCRGGILATSETWHTSSGIGDHAQGADQFPFYKKPNRRLRRITRYRKTQILVNNLGTPSAAKILHKDRQFIVLKAQVNQEKVMCFVDGRAERSVISRTLHERLKLSDTPIEATIMGLGGAITPVTKEDKVPLRLGKKSRPVKALVCDQVLVGDILLAADWLYKHMVTMTHRPPAIWFGGDRNTMINAIIETPQLMATTTGTVDPLYRQRYAELSCEPTALSPVRSGVDYELHLSGRPEPSPNIAVKGPEAIAFIRKQRDDLLKKGCIEARPSPLVPPAAAFVVFDKTSDSRGASTNPWGKPRVFYN